VRTSENSISAIRIAEMLQLFLGLTCIEALRPGT
jgi:hypothetical protein